MVAVCRSDSALVSINEVNLPYVGPG